MSIEIRATIACDECGARIIGPAQLAITHGLDSCDVAKKEALKRHWMILQRYGKPRHLCGPCADGKKGSSETIMAERPKPIERVFPTRKKWGWSVIAMAGVFLCGCSTIQPKPVAPVATPGVVYVVGETVDGRPILTPLGITRYNGLVLKYGHEFEFIPPLQPGDGLTSFTNGTAIIDTLHFRDFKLMDDWQNRGVIPAR